jgi:GMP synthase (glutamine-hydrolysing)
MMDSSSNTDTMDCIVVIDFGSQYSQLIARRIREIHVYSEIFSYRAPESAVVDLRPKGFILSGGPSSVYEAGAPTIPPYVLASGLPVLGICYGMQAMTHSLGGKVARSTKREYGPAELRTTIENAILQPGIQKVWMSHGDRIEIPPPGFEVLADSGNSPNAAIGDRQRNWYGLQFHPEVQHTPGGTEILRAFVMDVCGARAQWKAAPIIERSLHQIREQVGDGHVIAGVSGGVDSSVAAALVYRALGDQLTCIFVNNGLMRRGEPELVTKTFQNHIGADLISVDETEAFLDALENVSDPESKRSVIGEVFIRSFEEQSRAVKDARFLVQGTIYPDVIESSDPERATAHRIKTHHNVGGIPEDMQFELIEPLRYLFKDEVRMIGLALGLPEELVWRQPFPGPGLAVRCLGEITHTRLEKLRTADSILLEELNQAGLATSGSQNAIHAEAPPQSIPAQAFAVLLPVRSVGVMGDQRTYGETIALRAVTTDDFMTADWARIPQDVLARISARIVNEVPDVTRVVYDITSKPPATIEWE